MDKVARNFFQLGRQKAMQDLLANAKPMMVAAETTPKWTRRDSLELAGIGVAGAYGGKALRRYLDHLRNIKAGNNEAMASFNQALERNFVPGGEHFGPVVPYAPILPPPGGFLESLK